MKPLNEISLVFLLVISVIWGNDYLPFPGWSLALPAVFFLLNYWYKNPQIFKDIWRAERSNGQHLLILAACFIVFWRGIILVGEIWNPQFWNQPDLFKKFLISTFFYLGNALWQQVLINGYFFPRLEEGLKSEKKSLLVLGILFGLTHIPNPVLIPVTMIGGALSAYFFKRTRNIYVLIVAHSVLAVSIMYFLPHSWHHHLNVGPRYFRCR